MSEIGITTSTTAAAYVSTYGRKAANSNSKTEEKSTGAADSAGAVYEKSSSDNGKKATYSINKMSEEQRAELVKQMKNDAAMNKRNMLKIVNESLTDQAKKFTEANDEFWSKLAKGGFSVSAAAKEKAQELISEDGYFGVKQTAERIFNFASALAGDDVEKMKDMQAAFEKGYKLATKSWGKELPSISQDTHKAVTDKFNDYYDSKKTVISEE